MEQIPPRVKHKKDANRQQRMQLQQRHHSVVNSPKAHLDTQGPNLMFPRLELARDDTNNFAVGKHSTKHEYSRNKMGERRQQSVSMTPNTALLSHKYQGKPEHLQSTLDGMSKDHSPMHGSLNQVATTSNYNSVKMSESLDKNAIQNRQVNLLRFEKSMKQPLTSNVQTMAEKEQPDDAKQTESLLN